MLGMISRFTAPWLASLSAPHLSLQQLAQQPLGCLLVAVALDQDVEHDASLVHGSPKPILYPGNF